MGSNPTRRWGIIAASIVALSGAAAHPPSAAGQDTPPIEDVSAVDQYRESLPTTKGRRAVGQAGAAKEKPASLKAKTKQQLERLDRREGALLERVATSSEYGAPARRASEASAGAEAQVTDGAARPLILLAGLLVTITAAAAAIAVRRRRAT